MTRWWPLAAAGAGVASCVAMSSLFLALGGQGHPCDGIGNYWEHERMGPVGAGFVAAGVMATPILFGRRPIGPRGAAVARVALVGCVGIFFALWRVPWQVVTLQGKHYDERVPLLYLAWGLCLGVASAYVSRSSTRERQG